MTKNTLPQLQKVSSKRDILHMQDVVSLVYVSDNIFHYVRNLVFATRFPADYGLEDISHYIEFGASPRASLALIQASKVLACLHGRDFVIPEDIKEIAPDVLRHRIIPSYEAIADDISSDDIVEKILNTIEII